MAASPSPRSSERSTGWLRVKAAALGVAALVLVGVLVGPAAANELQRGFTTFPPAEALDASAAVAPAEDEPEVPAAVIALGDSYSSGLGAGGYTNDCDHTPHAWGSTIFGDAVTERTLLACSGASIADVALQVEQLAALPGEPGGRLITVTVGGNDIGFADELVNCLLSFLSCTRREEELAERIDGLRRPLAELYRSIQDVAPGDEIIVGGYPMLVPDPAVREDCSALTGLLSVRERQMIRRLGVALNDVIDRAAADAGVPAVSSELEELFDGHEACSNGPDDWLYGVKLSWPTGDEQGDGPSGATVAESDRGRWSMVVSLVKDSFHPNLAGQAGYAQAFEDTWFNG